MNFDQEQLNRISKSNAACQQKTTSEKGKFGSNKKLGLERATK